VQGGVALLIIVSGLLLTYAVYRVGQVFDVFASRYEIATLVPSALGLREGAPVTLAGQRIGQVKAHRVHPRRAEGRRQQPAHRDRRGKRSAGPDRVDSRAFLRTQGLLGDKFVDIEPGSSGARILQPGDTLAAGESIDIDQFLTQAAGALDQATGIVTNLQELTGGLSRGEGTMGQLLQDDQLYANLNATTAEMRNVLAQINRADGTFGRLIRDPAMYVQMHSAITRMDSLGAMILHGDGSMAQLLRSDSLYRSMLGTLTTADSAVTDLASLVNQLATGDGTIQRMMSDPELYDQFLRAVVEVQTLIADIRLNPGNYKPNITVDVF
jgi:phospholipid/cholesterol/gamma-HCH transport system substrate-binding protein